MLRPKLISQLKALARRENRPFSRQAELILERGLQAQNQQSHADKE